MKWNVQNYGRAVLGKTAELRINLEALAFRKTLRSYLRYLLRFLMDWYGFGKKEYFGEESLRLQLKVFRVQDQPWSFQKGFDPKKRRKISFAKVAASTPSRLNWKTQKSLADRLSRKTGSAPVYFDRPLIEWIFPRLRDKKINSQLRIIINDVIKLKMIETEQYRF